jgi:hypothetical protein
MNHFLGNTLAKSFVSLVIAVRFAPACSAQTTLPTTDAAVSGPAAAMNAAVSAIENLDAGRLADLFDVPGDIDGQFRQELAKFFVEDMRVFYAGAARFGRDRSVRMCESCGVAVPPRRPYVDSDWRILPGNGNRAVAVGEARGAFIQHMVRGTDGLWRIQVRGQPGGSDDEMASARRQRLAQLVALSAQIEAGKYPTPDAVIAEDTRQKQELSKRVQDLNNEKLARENARLHAEMPTKKYDPSTLLGVIDVFMQGLSGKDAVTIGKCYFVDGDIGGKFAKANADRVVAAVRLMDAMNNQGGAGLAMVHNFGLILKHDEPMMSDDPQVNGDRATTTFEDGSKMIFRKDGGVWKIDVTPASKAPLGEQAAAMERDAQVVNQIAADVTAGKYKTDAQVRDALLAAKLSAEPDPDFKAKGYKLQGE